jgi:hypothetical protein
MKCLDPLICLAAAVVASRTFRAMQFEFLSRLGGLCRMFWLGTHVPDEFTLPWVPCAINQI